MTIASQTSRISYTGDGVTTAFSVPFYFQANADLVVYLQSTAGVQTAQVLGFNYNLTGVTNPSGGTCTFTTAPASGYLVTIYRDPPLTQTTSYNNNDPFPAKSHELALDKLTMLEQRTRDLVTRVIKLPDSDPAQNLVLPTINSRANKALGFDGSGNFSPGPFISQAVYDGINTAATNAAASAAAAAASAASVSTGVAKAISGLVPSNNATTPNTKLDIAAGTARDGTNIIDITLAAGITKTTAAWVVGTGNGGLDTGAIAVNTCYHIYIIRKPTGPTVDILFSTSAVTPTMPALYTQKRRIGAFKTDASGFILPGQWRADGSFELTTPITVAADRALGLASLLTLPVPLGVKVRAKCLLSYENRVDAGNPAFFVIFRDPDMGAPTAATQATLHKPAGVFGGATADTWTSTAGQVYTFSVATTANNLLNVFLQGWFDARDEFL